MSWEAKEGDSVGHAVLPRVQHKDGIPSAVATASVQGSSHAAWRIVAVDCMYICVFGSLPATPEP